MPLKNVVSKWSKINQSSLMGICCSKQVTVAFLFMHLVVYQTILDYILSLYELHDQLISYKTSHRTNTTIPKYDTQKCLTLFMLNSQVNGSIRASIMPVWLKYRNLDFLQFYSSQMFEKKKGLNSQREIHKRHDKFHFRSSKNIRKVLLKTRNLPLPACCHHYLFRF